MTIYEVIDLQSPTRPRYRRALWIFGRSVPISLWRPCGPFSPGYRRRWLKDHCAQCAKYQDWVD